MGGSRWPWWHRGMGSQHSQVTPECYARMSPRVRARHTRTATNIEHIWHWANGANIVAMPPKVGHVGRWGAGAHNGLKQRGTMRGVNVGATGNGSAVGPRVGKCRSSEVTSTHKWAGVMARRQSWHQNLFGKQRRRHGLTHQQPPPVGQHHPV